jgi:cell division septation protein DedD
MRNIFLALVLANLAYAAWHAWYASPPRTVRPAPANVPGITLVSELPADVVEQVAPVVAAIEPTPEPAAPEAEPAGEPRCVSVGPFRELAQAATAAANFRSAGYQPTQRVAEGDIWIGYWVYIESIPTEEQANDILSKVRATGVTDSYVIPNSDSGNLVSLGVFSEIGGVTRRREDVRRLGYEPTVVDRTRRATVYWVDVVLGPDETLDLETLQAPGRIIRLEQRACDPAPA